MVTLEDGMAVGKTIDLDRVVFDPEYRRAMIDLLNRETPDARPANPRRRSVSARGETATGNVAASQAMHASPQ